MDFFLISNKNRVRVGHWEIGPTILVLYVEQLEA